MISIGEIDIGKFHLGEMLIVGQNYVTSKLLIWCLAIPVLKMCLKKMSLTSTVFHRFTHSFARAKRLAAASLAHITCGRFRSYVGVSANGGKRKLSIFETRCVSKKPSSFRYPTFFGKNCDIFS